MRRKDGRWAVAQSHATPSGHLWWDAEASRRMGRYGSSPAGFIARIEATTTASGSIIWTPAVSMKRLGSLGTHLPRCSRVFQNVSWVVAQSHTTPSGHPCGTQRLLKGWGDTGQPQQALLRGSRHEILRRAEVSSVLWHPSP